MTGKFLYRVLRDDEDYRKGLVAKDPQASVSVEDHVGRGSSQGFKSKYISTSKTLEAAELFASKSYPKPNTIVQIDLKKLQQVHEQEFQGKLEEGQVKSQLLDQHQYISEQLELDRQQAFEDSQYQLPHYQDTQNKFEDLRYYLEQFVLDIQQLFKDFKSQLIQQIHEELLRAKEKPRIIDLQEFEFQTPRAHNFARKFKEVLIVGKVPASCVSFCKLVS